MREERKKVNKSERTTLATESGGDERKAGKMYGFVRVRAVCGFRHPGGLYGGPLSGQELEP